MAAQPLANVDMSYQHLTQLSLKKIPHDVKELNCESLSLSTHINKITSVEQPVDIIASWNRKPHKPYSADRWVNNNTQTMKH